jgi:hypothetical protein
LSLEIEPKILLKDSTKPGASGSGGAIIATTAPATKNITVAVMTYKIKKKAKSRQAFSQSKRVSAFTGSLLLSFESGAKSLEVITHATPSRVVNINIISIFINFVKGLLTPTQYMVESYP